MKRVLQTLSLATILAMSAVASQYGDIDLKKGDSYYVEETKKTYIHFTPSEKVWSSYLWYAYANEKDFFAQYVYDAKGYYIDFQNDVDMNVLEVWKMGIFGDGVKVGFIEDSYDTLNPDIDIAAGRLLGEENDSIDHIDFRYIDKDTNKLQEDKKTLHGLATTSLLAGRHDKFGTAGIAPKAKLYLYALGNERPHAREFMQIFDWFYQKGVRVVNVSMGFERYLDVNEEEWKTLIQKMRELEKKGMVFVVASGNKNIEGSIYNLDFLFEQGGAIHVGGVLPNGERWTARTTKGTGGSNYGGFLDFVAPTVVRVDSPMESCDFYNCENLGNRRLDAGTSMSAPLVTGTIAMMLEINPNLSVSKIKDILAKTAIKLGSDKFPLNTGKTYEYHTCVQGEDRNSSYDVFDFYANEESKGYVNGYYKSHSHPYDTFLCQKYSWNKEMGYGMVDAEGAVREAINRITNPAQARKLLLKNEAGVYHFPQAVVAKLKSIAGDTSTDTDSVNRLVQNVQNISDHNWHLLGASKATDAQELIDAGASWVWVYRDNKWYYKSSAPVNVENDKVGKLNTINADEGVWVVK